jgi:hypothetical protein
VDVKTHLIQNNIKKHIKKYNSDRSNANIF